MCATRAHETPTAPAPASAPARLGRRTTRDLPASAPAPTPLGLSCRRRGCFFRGLISLLPGCFRLVHKVTRVCVCAPRTHVLNSQFSCSKLAFRRRRRVIYSLSLDARRGGREGGGRAGRGGASRMPGGLHFIRNLREVQTLCGCFTVRCRHWRRGTTQTSE